MSDTILNSLVKAVKSRPELAMVTCIYTNSREISQNPNCGFVLGFETGKVKFTKNKSVRLFCLREYKLSLLAPTGASGKRLAEVAMWVAEALRGADIDGNLESVTIEKQHYKETTAVLYCDIDVFVSDTKGNGSCNVYFNGNLQRDITSVSSKSQKSSVKTGELLNGYVETAEKYYVITVTSDKSLALPFGAFEMVFESAGSSEVYKNCVVTSEKCVQNAADGMSYIYEFKGEK